VGRRGHNSSYFAARQDDALVAWLAMLATNDLTSEAGSLQEIDMIPVKNDAADAGLATIDLAFEYIERSGPRQQGGN
jgi:hypothetical protein